MVVLAKPEKQGSSRRSSSAAASVLLVPKRNVDWVMPSDVPTDIVIEAGGTSFALHKFPLVSRSGRIRKETRDSGPSYVRLPDIPGGEETFELVAKFCYGLNVEINPSNAALLRCAAQYLDMTDDYGDNNLISRTEAFINGVSKLDLTAGVALLHSCEALLPMAEDLKIVSTCIDAIADKACEQYSEYNDSMVVLHANSQVHRTGNVYWWAEDLAILSIGFYKRILAAMISRGLPSKSIGGTLMVYAQRALKGIINKQIGREAGILHKEKLDTTVAMEEEQRAFVEAIVAMLPHEKSIIMCSFLFGLLRSAMILDCSISCRIDLEQRIGMQLDQATLDDILIPAFSYSGETVFDIDTVHRLLINFMQQKDKEDSQAGYESDAVSSPSQAAIIKVAKLLDGYLAEIAPEASLKLNKFIGLCELIPEYARILDDGLYRAIDIYLKAHPGLNEQDRKKLCKLLDVQKLSQEACAHAAQNDRLPVQMVVQVLYFEQVRLRAAMAASMIDGEQIGHFNYHKLGSGALSAAVSPRDHYASIRRENRELKLEVARMRMRLTELEKDHVSMKHEMGKSHSATYNFFHTCSKRLSKLNPFHGKHASLPPEQTPDSRHSSRRRRHSIS